MENRYAVEMLHITKAFGAALANDDISLQLRKGEIHALLGENGAGKSTLMNVLFGLLQPDTGEIRKDGKRVVIRDPNDANRLGIGMVHQHFKLIDIYTVLQNIILGAEPNKFGILKADEARQKVQDLAERYGMQVDLDAKVENITVGMQQRVEILKMLYRDNEILIFDEPTAVLTPQEIQELLHTMKALTAEGCSILFITHHLEEIMQVADRCTIISQGRYIGTVNIADTTKEELSTMMVGRKVELHAQKKESVPGKPILEVHDLCVPATKGKAVDHVSFDVREGEIVCIAGIDGNGQSELVGGITGMLPVTNGTVTLTGQDITKAPIRRRSVLGISHVPEDRLKHALVLQYSVEDNMILQRYFDPEFTNKFGFMRRKNIRSFAETLMKKFDVRTSKGALAEAQALSGGNQQKLVIARELEKDPLLLVAVQPVRGLDVGAVEYIHNQLIAQRDAGKAVLLVSFELEEVLNVSDRIIVLFEGQVVGEFKPSETTAEELGLYMAGGKRQERREATV